ncbi:MAG TPA: response regulator [Chthoniobacterales bacterium]|jgi:CheY-like chemotaxis protein|nr:response regulator [Chthoniobacterales bacterium]
MQPLQNIKVLVVEDHSDIRSLISRILKSKGASVSTASDGSEGLQAVIANHPDVVLSDIRMPHRSGLELVKDILALGSEDGGSVPVIAMSADFDSFSRRRTNAAGFREHLNKPFSPNELLNVIVSVLNPT